MTVSTAAAAYQVRIADSGVSQVEGNVALTLDVATDVHGIPVLSGPSVDVLHCTSTSVPFEIECLVDDALFVSGGRLTELGRLIEVRRADDGGAYATIATGRVSHTSEMERGRVKIGVSDERWTERESEIFRTTDSVQLHPYGLVSAWRDVPAAGTTTYAVRAISGNAVQITTVPNEGIEGFQPDYDSRLPQQLLDALLSDMVARPSISATNSAGNFNSLRFEYDSADRTVISFNDTFSASLLQPQTRRGPLGPLSPVDGEGILRFAWVYISSHGLSVNDIITGRFHFPDGVTCSEHVPQHIGGVSGIHPMVFLQNILDGDYGGDPVVYPSSAMTALQAISMMPIWGRIEGPLERSEWLEKNLYSVYAIAPLTGTDLAYIPTSLWQPLDEDPDTYEVLDATNAEIPNWNHVSKDVVNVVRFTSRRVVGYNESNSAPSEFPVDWKRTIPHQVLPIEHDNVSTLGDRVRTIDTELIFELDWSPDDVQRVLSTALFNVFGDGPQEGEITVPDTVSVQVGDHVSLDHDTLRGFNPSTGDRSGNRIVQLVEFYDRRPDRLTFRYLDKGPHAQPLDPPTVSIAQGSELDYVEVTISGLSAGETAVVEVAAGSSPPSQFTLSRAGVGNATIEFLLGAATGNAYVRAKTVAYGRIESDWATDNVALTARPLVESVAIKRFGTGALVSWSVSSNTLGMRTDYAVHARSESPTFGSNQTDYDATDGGFSITSLVSSRDVVSVQLTPYTGWTGSAVSGSAGDPVVVELLFPTIVPGGIVLPIVRPSIEITFNANGEVIVSAGGDENTANIYVTVGDGSAPSDPTVASNDGVISGQSGSVDTGVKITTGNQAFVRAAAANTSGTLGPVAVVQSARSIGPFHKDTTTRSVTGTTNETALESITIPAGLLGDNGGVRLDLFADFNGVAGNKTLRLYLNSDLILEHVGGADDIHVQLLLFNANDDAVQDALATVIRTVGGNAYTTLTTHTEDSTADMDIDITGELADGGDGIELQMTFAELVGTN